MVAAEDFPEARQFGTELCGMCVTEGILEKQRRDLALRQDYNIGDLYKMLLNLQMGKPGVDSNDLYEVINHNLELPMTRDEVFIIFAKIDKDGDSIWNFSEVMDAFCPREPEYKHLIDSRGGFYNDEASAKDYFEPKTREFIKKYIRGFCETEIAIEKIRQKIINGIRIRPEKAFRVLDRDGKGYVTIDDFREFLRLQNMYPIEKNLGLMFERFNKSGS